MMNNRTRNKTELALRLGHSRNTLYAYMRLPGFPVPDRRGQWNIEAVRKFIAKQNGKRQIVPSEKEQLEMQLLRRRIRKVDLEIHDLDNTRAEEITTRITADCQRVMDALKSAVWRMPDELSGIFSMLGEPMAIYKRFRSEIRQRFQIAHEALQKIKEQSRRKTPKNKKEAENVVPFKRSAAN